MAMTNRLAYTLTAMLAAALLLACPKDSHALAAKTQVGTQSKAEALAHEKARAEEGVQATMKVLAAARAKLGEGVASKSRAHLEAKAREKATAMAQALVGMQAKLRAQMQTQTHAEAQIRAQALAQAKAGVAMAMSFSGLTNFASGRGRGRGRTHEYMGPDEFDDSWWLPPPPVGADPFLQGYSQHVYPRHHYGYGGMPYGGYGTAHHFWGGPSYPRNMPWWRGRSFTSNPRQGRSPYQPYTTPRDSFGVGFGSSMPLQSPYYYTPPPLQGDWNLPKNPPPPPAAEKK